MMDFREKGSLLLVILIVIVIIAFLTLGGMSLLGISNSNQKNNQGIQSNPNVQIENQVKQKLNNINQQHDQNINENMK